MAYDDPGNVQTSRAELFKKAYGQSRTQADDGRTPDQIRASAEQTGSGERPVDVSEAQLRTVPDAAKGDEERLATLETQTRGLNRAGIAIAEMIQTVTPAGRALKADLPGTDGRSASTDVESPPAKAG